MTAAHVTFTGAIREMAKRIGRVASDDAVERLNIEAQSLGEIVAETGTLSIRTAPDKVQPFTDWLSQEVGRWPAPLPVAPVSGSGFTGMTAAAATLAARIRVQDDADATAHANALANGPNPFRPGGNRTHAAIISHRLPEVAARLQAQAKP